MTVARRALSFALEVVRTFARNRGLLLAVLAPRRVGWRVALVTGAVVALSWQPVEAGLAWFFENVSTVGVLYGSVAGLVVAMLSLEVAAVMFLLGAQAIALYIMRQRACDEEAP